MRHGHVELTPPCPRALLELVVVNLGSDLKEDSIRCGVVGRKGIFYAIFKYIGAW